MYKIRLDQFQGPLDLLLFFIKRDELDIYDIPISEITSEYLQYVHLIQLLDLETAGDFILLASTLMHIKVRMLLPREIDEKGEEIDPRAELVERLLEYKRFKETSEELAFLETQQRKLFFRGNFENDEIEKPPEIETFLKNISIFDLAKAFRKAMETKKDEPVHEVKKIPVTIEQQIDFIVTRVRTKKNLSFIELASEIKERIALVVTFVAMLEMVRAQIIGIRESGDFNDFIIYEVDTSNVDKQKDVVAANSDTESNNGTNENG